MALFDPNDIPEILERRGLLYGYLAVSAVVGVAVAYLVGWRWLFPVLSGALIYPVFFMCIVAGESRLALGTMLLWCVLMSVLVIGATLLFPQRSQQVILSGGKYVQQEMTPWIAGEVAKEGDIRLFLPDHLLHFAVFVILSLVSGGLFSLVMGAYLLNYMNYYVGWLIGHAAHPWWAVVIGWSPWSVLRVVGYILVAIGLSDIPVSRLFHRPVDRRVIKCYAVTGCSLAVLDIICKSLLAPVWASLLREVLGGRV